MPSGVYDRSSRARPLRERLEAKIVKNEKSGCWEWTGTKGSFGHGQLYRGGPQSGGRKLVMAHRASWEIHRGEIPKGLCVLHKCDVPWCVNPDHLFLGTKADNSADMVSKGRQKRGEDLPQSKLTRTQVEAIRATSLPQKDIAALCGVSQSLISQIKSGAKW